MINDAYSAIATTSEGVVVHLPCGTARIKFEDCIVTAPIRLLDTPQLPVPMDSRCHNFSIHKPEEGKPTAIIDGKAYTLINKEWCSDE